MSLLNSLVSSMAGGGQSSGLAALLPAALDFVKNYPGGLAGLLEKLSQGGLSDIVASWLGSGENLPVTGPQLRSALGEEDVGKLASQTGQDADSVLGSLASVLPQVIDRLTPDGVAPESGKGLDMMSLMGVLASLSKK